MHGNVVDLFLPECTYLKPVLSFARELSEQLFNGYTKFMHTSLILGQINDMMYNNGSMCVVQSMPIYDILGLLFDPLYQQREYEKAGATNKLKTCTEFQSLITAEVATFLQQNPCCTQKYYLLLYKDMQYFYNK